MARILLKPVVSEPEESAHLPPDERLLGPLQIEVPKDDKIIAQLEEMVAHQLQKCLRRRRVRSIQINHGHPSIPE